MRRVLAAMGGVVVVLAGGCERPRTEIVARVDSEVGWGEGREIQSVVLSVRRGGAAGALRSARTTALGAGAGRLPLPLSVGVIAADDEDDTPVWIEALGCADPNGCAPAAARVAQRAVVRFTRGETQELPLLLASACLGVQCRSDERCAAGSGVCEPATRAQETLRPIGASDASAADAPLATDRPAAVDASPTDAPATVDLGAPTDRGAASEAGADAGVRDVPAADAGATDGGGRDVPMDAGVMDAGVMDAGVMDAGVRDVPMDAGAVDAGAMDTGRVDAGPRDAGAADSGAADAGRVDVGPPDAGPGDVGVQCAAPLALCGGACVNTQTSSAHCGLCGRACSGGRSCAAGICVGGSTYTVDTAVVIATVDACGAPGSVRILESVDDVAVAVPLPFATSWWGAALPAGTPMAVSSNGAVQVNGADGAFVRFQAIPSVAAPNGVIAAQWRDLYTSSDGVCVATVGAAPSRRWVAQWVDTAVLGVASDLYFEVIVHEGTGVIDLVYDAMNGVGEGSVGLENPTGTQAVGGCGTTRCSIAANSRIRFTPGG